MGAQSIKKPHEQMNPSESYDTFSSSGFHPTLLPKYILIPLNEILNAHFREVLPIQDTRVKNFSMQRSFFDE